MDKAVRDENSAAMLLIKVGSSVRTLALRHFLCSAVGTASFAQVRQPIYKGPVGRWRRFAAQLGPLIEALGEPWLEPPPA
jgi:hypothetical protein